MHVGVGLILTSCLMGKSNIYVIRVRLAAHVFFELSGCSRAHCSELEVAVKKNAKM